MIPTLQHIKNLPPGTIIWYEHTPYQDKREYYPKVAMWGKDGRFRCATTTGTHATYPKALIKLFQTGQNRNYTILKLG